MKWPVEDIPDGDLLYRRVHVNLLPANKTDGTIPPGAFLGIEGISVDWSKYSTASDSLARSRQPAMTGIIQILAGDVRRFKELSVIHAPLDDNRAHSNINGFTKCDRITRTDLRKMLSRNASWIIEPRVKD